MRLFTRLAAALRAAPLLAALPLMTGCSAIGLTDGIEQASGCGDCSELNALTELEACTSWECDTAENVCVIALIDEDDDGSPSAECATEGGDCDDLDPLNGVGRAEVCDGYDNDCSLAADDGLVFEVVDRLETGMLTGLSSAPGIEQVAYVIGRVLTIATPSAETAATTTSSPLAAVPNTSAETALAEVGDGLAVAYAAASPCQALVLGGWRPDSSDILLVGDDGVDGLPQSGGCPSSVVVSSPALASRAAGTEVVAAWLEDGGERTACGETGAGNVAAIVGRGNAASGWQPATPMATVVARHAGLGGPVLETVGTDTVLGVVSEAGRVQLYALDESGGSLTARLLHEEAECGEGCGRIALHVADIDGEPQLGLAYRAGGCGEAGEVRFRTFRVAGGEFEPIDSAATVVGSGNIQGVAVSGRDAAPSWAIAWTDGQRLLVQRTPWPAPLAELVAVTGDGNLSASIRLRYGDALSALVYDPSPPARLLEVSLACPARPPPTSD